MREYLRQLNAPCRDMTALISASQDRDLPRSARFAVRLHLLYCTACRRFAGQVKFLRKALRILADEPETAYTKLPAPTLTDEARKRLRDALPSD